MGITVTGIELANILNVSASVITALVNDSDFPHLPRTSSAGGDVLKIDIEDAYRWLNNSSHGPHLQMADRIRVLFPEMAVVVNAETSQPDWTIADIPGIVDTLTVHRPRTLNETRTIIRIWQEAEDAKARYRSNQKSAGELVEIRIINHMIEQLHSAIQTNLGDGFQAWAESYGLPPDAWLGMRERLYNDFKGIVDETAVLVGAVEETTAVAGDR